MENNFNREAIEILVRNCQSIDQVVDLIQSETACQFEGYEIAAVYAFDCVDMEYYDSEMDIDENALDNVGFYPLNNSGAEYDYSKALELALSFRTDDNEELFYRENEDGNAVIFDKDGCSCNRFNDSMPLVYPVDSSLSAYYEHNDGIILTVEDAEKCGIEAED
jgi:hypothetical protein